MTSKRKGATPTARLGDGRYLRFSHRYNAWQMQDRFGYWRNVRPEIARCYAAAGFPIGVQPDAKPGTQLELF